jgi:hypothetical protein
MDNDAIRRAILAQLGRRPTPGQRHQVAGQLRELAAEQERIADAEQRDAARPAARRLAPRAKRAGPGDRPGDFVRIERKEDKRGSERLTIYVGRALWYAAGSPRRLDIQRLHGALWLIPADGDHGYAVGVRAGLMPRLRCDSARDLVGHLSDGRYQAEASASGIVIGQ